MSKIAIAAAETGTGTFTLASPATNTDRTLTLPDEAGTVALQRAGNVLQVLQTVKTDTTSFLSSSVSTFQDISGMAVTITPTSVTSKILVFFTANVSQSTGATIHVRIARDSTPLYVGDAEGNRVQSSAVLRSDSAPYAYEIGNLQGTFLDAPATTSAITYKLQGTLGSSYTGSLYLNRAKQDDDQNYAGRPASSITVMEIAG